MTVFKVNTLLDESDGIELGSVSLREAIEAANHNPEADTIEFDSSLSGGEILLTNGELAIADDLTIDGLGSNLLTINGNNSSRIFNIDDGNDANLINVVIGELKITGGHESEEIGGGIFNLEDLLVSNSTVTKNTAYTAGGIANLGGNLTLTNSTVAENTATSGLGSGGIGNLGGNLAVAKSTISNNVSNGNSGGIGSGPGDLPATAEATITDSTIVGNQAVDGGGIGNGSIMTISNSTISGNNANSIGAIANGGQLTVTNSTITGNQADRIGGILNVADNEELTKIENTIVAGNSATDSPDVSGNFTSNEHNIIGDTYGSTGFENDLSESNIDQILDTTLANNGGYTPTHALVSNSIAIDAGNNDDIPENLTTDQRDFNRIVDGNEDTIATVDLGAYEANKVSDVGLDDGNLLLSSISDQTVKLFDREGNYIRDFVSSGSGGLTGPNGLEIGPDDDLYVSDIILGSILRYDGETGAFIEEFVPSGTGGLNIPYELKFGPDGNLYVNNYPNSPLNPNPDGSDSILVFDGTTGDFVRSLDFSAPITGPLGLVFGADGSLYVSASETDSVLRYDFDSQSFETFISPGSGGLDGPADLDFDEAGDNLYVNSFLNDRVLRYDGSTGDFVEVFATSSGSNLIQPSGIVFGPEEDVFVSSFGNGNLERYSVENGDFVEVFVASNQTNGTLRNTGVLFVDEESSIAAENIFGTVDEDIIEVNPVAIDSEQIFTTPKIVLAGDGDDLIDAAVSVDRNVSLENRLYGQSGHDELIAGSNDLLFGGKGNDTLDASLGGGENRAFGDSGDDTFFLGTGDRLVGGEGDDSFFALGGGNNTITGGAGADAFWIANAEIVETANIITDFDEFDVVGIGGLGITSREELNLFQDGDSVSIGFNDAEIAKLQNTQVDTLNADSFAFA